ncbi:MAG TPA: hypothetical protein ENI05_09985 [Porticoccus sp.]|nr:hypothetical protein [Porticoccus sp.]
MTLKNAGNAKKHTNPVFSCFSLSRVLEIVVFITGDLCRRTLYLPQLIHITNFGHFVKQVAFLNYVHHDKTKNMQTTTSEFKKVDPMDQPLMIAANFSLDLMACQLSPL